MNTTIFVIMHHHYIYISGWHCLEMQWNVILKINITANHCKICSSICGANTCRKCTDKIKIKTNKQKKKSFTYCSILGLVLTSPSTVMSEKSILNLLSSVAILHGGQQRALGFKLQTTFWSHSRDVKERTALSYGPQNLLQTALFRQRRHDFVCVLDVQPISESPILKV